MLDGFTPRAGSEQRRGDEKAPTGATLRTARTDPHQCAPYRGAYRLAKPRGS